MGRVPPRTTQQLSEGQKVAPGPISNQHESRLFVNAGCWLLQMMCQSSPMVHSREWGRKEDPPCTYCCLLCVCVYSKTLLTCSGAHRSASRGSYHSGTSSKQQESKQPRPWQPILILSEQANKWSRDAGLLQKPVFLTFRLLDWLICLTP